jgi:hypothetical protein
VSGQRQFGEPIAADVPVVRLGQIVAAPEQYAGRAIRIEGTAVAVCQRGGCWTAIRDDATLALVRMHGHSFFLPRDIAGHRLLVQGTVVGPHTPATVDPVFQQTAGRLADVDFDAHGVQID